MLKTIFSVMLAIALCFSMAACSLAEDQYADEAYWYSSGREIDESKPDVFYIVSTVLLTSHDEQGNETKLAALNSEDIQAMDEEISDIASHMFTEEFNFFAPYYHEVTMNTGLSSTDEEKAAYFAQAQAEVNAAFDYYMSHLNNGRPFIIAGYSQGALLAKGLLKHMTDEQIENMAAAYIMGGSITEADLENSHILPAEGAEDLHVTVSYNSVANTDACWDTLTGKNVCCINPINWKTDETPASFVYNGKEATVHIDSASHVLIVDGLDPNDYYLPDWPFPLGNYHNEEIHFYADSVRENALLRLEKLQASKGIPTKAANPELITEVKAANGELIGVALDIGTYESLDEEAALALMESRYRQELAKVGCTCVVKDRSAESEGLLIGRNMDLSLSDKALYKFQLNYGKYKAMGIAYTNFSGPTAEAARQGLTSEEKFLNLLPALGSDYLNEAGLYIETNMRNMDYGENPDTDYQASKYGCTGTNPGKGLPNLFLSSVPFYVVTRCATVDEVLDLLRNDVNIYTSVTSEEQYKENGAFALDWNFAFVVADAQGNYGLIEVAGNEVVYTPNYGQANFYRNEALAAKEIYPSGGWGKIAAMDYTACDEENVSGAYLDGKKCRYAVATEGLADVHTAEDMQKNMRKVLYSQLYSGKADGLNAAINGYESSQFNSRYEMVQSLPLVRTGEGADDWALDFENGSIYLCTFEVITHMSTEKYQELFTEYARYHYAGKTKAQLMTEQQDYWITTQSVVTDIAARTWTVSFFESEEVFSFTIE